MAVFLVMFVAFVVSTIVLVVLVIMPTIVTGMDAVALAIEVPIDAFAFMAHAVGFIVLTPGFGAISLVFKAMLDAITLAIEVPFDALTF